MTNALKERGQFRSALYLMCDSEVILASDPGIGVGAAIDMQGSALSASGRAGMVALGNYEILKFSNRMDATYALAHNVYTKLAGYRTDLDDPTWEESYALLMHGAAVCRLSLEKHTNAVVELPAVQASIQSILAKSGGPEAAPVPTAKDLKGCNRRPKCWAIFNFIASTSIYLYLLMELGHLIIGNVPSPTLAIIVWLLPEPISNVDLKTLSNEISDSLCNRSVSDTKRSFADNMKIRFKVTVNEVTRTEAYSEIKAKSNSCNNGTMCLYTFRGDFSSLKHYGTQELTIVGLVIDIVKRHDDKLSVDLGSCIVK